MNDNDFEIKYEIFITTTKIRNGDFIKKYLDAYNDDEQLLIYNLSLEFYKMGIKDYRKAISLLFKKTKEKR